jgi:hypothetical protein
MSHYVTAYYSYCVTFVRRLILLQRGAHNRVFSDAFRTFVTINSFGQNKMTETVRGVTAVIAVSNTPHSNTAGKFGREIFSVTGLRFLSMTPYILHGLEIRWRIVIRRLGVRVSSHPSWRDKKIAKSCY